MRTIECFYLAYISCSISSSTLLRHVYTYQGTLSYFLTSGEACEAQMIKVIKVIKTFLSRGPILLEEKQEGKQEEEREEKTGEEKRGEEKMLNYGHIAPPSVGKP